jgi:D-alanine-D-alanine ligase
LRIGIAFDLAPTSRLAEGPDDLFEEFDKPETVEAIARALGAEGHEVALLGDGRELLSRLLDDPPDLIWNLAEGEGVGRCREARVPAVCEMLGVPYTGSDPLTLAAALDKPVAKTLVAEVVAVPRGCLLDADEADDRAEAKVAGLRAGSNGEPGRWVVKPAFEGSSKGIRSSSLVHSPADAVRLAQRLARDYRQPVLVEEYVEGDEVTVGLVGNGPGVSVIGAMRVRPRQPAVPFIYSLESKRDWDARIEYETPARLPAEVVDRVHEAARRAFVALGCRDVARVDFRVRDGVPVFLEANPLPGLAPDWSDLVILAKGMGLSHADLIRSILREALARLGLGVAVGSPRR